MKECNKGCASLNGHGHVLKRIQGNQGFILNSKTKENVKQKMALDNISEEVHDFFDLFSFILVYRDVCKLTVECLHACIY